MSFNNNDTAYSKFFDPKNKKMNERIVPIIEAIINDENSEESAVNIPNQNFIDSLPDNIVVEVPCTINKKGIKGLKLNNYPISFGLLLNNQVGTIKLTTEAILKKSKHLAYLAMIADPIVDDSKKAEKLLDTMINYQNEYLGYLK